MSGQSEFRQRVQDCTDRLSTFGVDALGALFDLTSHRLVRFAVTLTRNQHDAEDCVQTALVRVARQPNLLASVTCPWAYLLRMVRNEALLIGRRRRQRIVVHNLSDLITFRRVDELERDGADQAGGEGGHRERPSGLRR